MEFQRKYNVADDVYIPIIKAGEVNFAVGADWTPAAGDVKISKDGAAAVNIGTLPTAVVMGNGAMWKFVFTGAELSCKLLMVTVVDATTKAVEDTMFNVLTYGNASAQMLIDFAEVMRGTDSAALASVCTEARLSELDEATAGKMANQVDIIQTDTTTDIPALLPAALVGGRMDSSVGAVATDAISAAGVSAAAANKVSDHTWRRTVANVEASSDGDTIGTSRGAYVVLAKHNNKCGVSGGTLTVYQDDDITSVITQTVTSDASADPITDLDTV